MRRALAMAAAASAIVACDPVHGHAVAELGDEAPGVRRGPTHRPGQPCLVCHGGSGPGSPQFSVAGTVYPTRGVSGPGLAGVDVWLVDSNGSQYAKTTNDVGNFYVLQSEWSPNYPIRSVRLTYGGQVAEMKTLIGRDGSCAGCHTDPEGPASPGKISMQDAGGP